MIDIILRNMTQRVEECGAVIMHLSYMYMTIDHTILILCNVLMYREIVLLAYRKMFITHNW